MTTALITGGAGFIGSHLSELLLSKGARVTVLDNLSSGKTSNLPNTINLEVGDVQDEQLVSRLVKNADEVYHLAAISSVEKCEVEPLTGAKTNLIGSINVIDKVARLNPTIPLVFASSAAVYGMANSFPISESDTLAPISNYGADKRQVESYLENACRRFGMKSAALRFFNVFGPRQDSSSPYSGVISKFLDQMSNNQKVTIHSDGKQTRDFVYVSNVAEYMLRSSIWLRGSHAGTFASFNVCNGSETSINSLFDTLSGALSYSQLPQYSGPRGADVRRSLGDPTQLRKSLGVVDATDLRSGLELLVAWAQTLRVK